MKTTAVFQLWKLWGEMESGDGRKKEAQDNIK